MNRNLSRAFRYALGFLTVVSFLSGFLPSVLGDVPVVVSITQDPETPYTLVITILHENPSSDHYVDKLQFSVDGSTSICAVPEIALDPQEEEEFTITHSCQTPCHMSDVETLKDREVAVRAHCAKHGWSEWSDGVCIIEFNPLLLLAGIAALAIAVTAVKTSRIWSLAVR